MLREIINFTEDLIKDIPDILQWNSKPVFCFKTCKTSLNDCFSNCTVIVCCPNAFSLENAKCVNSNNTTISLQPNDSLPHLITQFLILLFIDNLFRSFLHTYTRTFRQIQRICLWPKQLMFIKT